MLKDALLHQTLETLLSPLGSERGGADSWRDEVNRALRRWTEADAAFFRVSDGSPTRVDPLTPELLAMRDAYRLDGVRALDPWVTRRVGPGEALVGGFRRLLGEGWRERSDYYLDFLQPRDIGNYVGAQLGADSGVFVTLGHFDLRKPHDEAAIARVTRRLHAVVPALRAGLEVWLAMRNGFDELGVMVDEVPEALLLCDETGAPVHANSALDRLVAADPDEGRLRTLLEEMAGDFAQACGGDAHDLYSRASERTLHTARGAYLVRPVVTDGRVRGADGAGVPGVLLMVRRKERPPSETRDPPRSATG